MPPRDRQATHLPRIRLGWRYTLFGLNLISALTCHPSLAAELKQIRALGNNQVELSGDFGAACQRCGILVDYDRGLTYAYQPKHWQAQKLVFRIQDIGRSLKVDIRVKTADGETSSKPLTIKPQLQPRRLQRKAIPLSSIDNKNSFMREHKDPFGGKGKDRFIMDTPPAVCQHKGELFHAVELVPGKKRFGDARIIRQPDAGCQKCKPVEVEWYHEPTGSIEYQLHIQMRIVDGICSDRIRH